jgi:Flp pilus assembly protein TadD
MRWIGVAATAIVVGTGPASAALHPSAPSGGEAQISPAQRAATLTASASTALSKGDANKAVQDVEAAVVLQPQDAALRALLGRAYLASGRFHSADTALGDALSLDPTLEHALINRVLARIAIGDRAGARALLAKAEGVASAADIGLAQALLGDSEGARRRLDAAARAPGADARTRQNLGLVYAMDGRWTDAAAIAQQDVPPNLMPQRLRRWAMIAQMKADPAMQIGAILGVLPAADTGQPAQLALVAPAPAPAQVADLTVVAQAAPKAARAPAAAPASMPIAATVPVAVAAPAPAEAPKVVAQAAPAPIAAPAPKPAVAPIAVARAAPAVVVAASPAPAASPVLAPVRPVVRVENGATVTSISPVAPPLEIFAAKLAVAPLALADLHASISEIVPASVHPEMPKNIALAGTPRTRDSGKSQVSFAAATAQPAKAAVAVGAAIPVADAAKKPGVLLASHVSLKREPAKALGNWAVQLGAFSTLDRRETAWGKLSGMAAFLSAYRPTGSDYRFGKVTLYRLSVSGLPTRAEAINLCVKLRAAGGACFVRNMSGDQPMRWTLKSIDEPVKLAALN